MASITLEFDAILFDMDGTLISSVDAVNSCREDFAAENGLDSEGYHHCRVSTSRKALPDPYLMGAERLNVPISRCIVVEDAPAGALAGLAAGATILAVNPDYYVDDLTQVSAEWKDGKHFVTINPKD